MTRRLAATMFATALAATGCSSDNAPEPEPVAAPACLEQLEAAAETNDEDVYGPLFDESLSVCTTSEEWLQALRTHPGAIGLKGPEFVDAISLASVCTLDVTETPVCADAVDQGLIPPPG